MHGKIVSQLGIRCLPEFRPVCNRLVSLALLLTGTLRSSAQANDVARLYAEAAQKAPNLAERDHLTRQAARLNAR